MSDNDYHLDAKDKEKVERLVPSWERQVFLAFRCKLQIDGKDIKDGVVALSEHYITFCKKSFMGGISHLEDVHILDLTYFGVPGKDFVALKMEDRELSIQGNEKAMKRFVVCLFRNYYIITSYLPKEYKLKFRPKDPDDFPKFDPRLSPGQQFQFLYNAYCMQDKIKYNHHIVQWVNYTAITMSGVFDLSKIPYHDIENSFASTVNIGPVFDALTFFPTLHGIVMRNVGRTDLFLAAAPLLSESTTCQIFVAEANNIVDGCDAIAQAFVDNRKLPLRYLDISDNPISDMIPICTAVSHLKSDVFYLDFSNTGMNDKAVVALMTSIEKNSHLWGIRYLNLGGASVRSSGAKAIVQTLNALKKNRKNFMKSFNPGNFKSGLCDILQILHKSQPQLLHLSLRGSKIGKSEFGEVLTFLANAEFLQSLDVSDCGLKPEQIAQIIKGITSRSISQFNLNLSNTKLGGKKLDPVLEALKAASNYSWGTLSFNSTNMDADDCLKLVKVLDQCRGIYGISFNDNLTPKMKNVGDALRELVTFADLKYLSIKGGSNKLGPMMAPYIKLASRTKLEYFDPSFNNFGEEGLDAIGDIIENSNTLQKLYIDGSGTTDAVNIVRVLDILKNCQTIRIMPFPFDDVYNIMKKVSKSNSKQLYQMLSVKQVEAQSAIQRNQTAAGIKTELTEHEYNPELNELVQQIIDSVAQTMGTQKPYEHSAINKAFNMPFPHLDEVDEKIEVEDSPLADDGSDVYHTPEFSCIVREEDNDAQLISNFNSMCVGERKRRDFSTFDAFAVPDYDEGEKGDASKSARRKPSKFSESSGSGDYSSNSED